MKAQKQITITSLISIGGILFVIPMIAHRNIEEPLIVPTKSNYVREEADEYVESYRISENNKTEVENEQIENQKSENSLASQTNIASREDIALSDLEEVFSPKQSDLSVRTFQVDVEDNTETQMLDISEFLDTAIVFRWKGNNFQYSLANNKTDFMLTDVEKSDEASIDPTITVSEIISVGSNNFLLLELTKETKELFIDVLESQNNGQVVAVANHSSGLKYSTLGIIPREVWSNDADINDPSRLVWDPVYYKVEKIVVHHTATPNGEDPIYWIKAIYNYHAYSLGWGDIGYNYLIDQYGNIYEGKLGGEEAKGYHAGSANASSIGISLIGTFTDATPSFAAREALVELIAEKSAFYDINPSWHVNVFGHRDFEATACPGNTFYPLLSGLTASANSYKNSHFAQIKSVASEVNAEFANSSYREGIFSIIFTSSSQAFVPSWSGIAGQILCTNPFCDERIYTFRVTTTSSPEETVEDRLRTLTKTLTFYNGVQSCGAVFQGEVEIL